MTQPLAGSGSPSPLVSVIVPTRDRLSTVRTAIASVRAQSYPAVELIVVDDGSIDGTPDWLAEQTDLVRVRTAGVGSGGARNAGLRVASGELIASLDSDDVWNPAFLAEAVAALRRHDAGVVFANWEADRAGDPGLEGALTAGMLRDAGEPGPDGWTTIDPAHARAAVLEGCPAPSSALLLRRDAVGDGWDARLRIGDDWGLLLGCALGSTPRMAFTREPLWRKGFDGTNQHDGVEWLRLARDLHWHDGGVMLRRHGASMAPAERRRWRRRRLAWGVRVHGVRIKRTLRCLGGRA